MLGNTLAASFIWGINTIFLLDAGLSNAEAFAANAFFTAGMVLFEVPTGIVADTIGRRSPICSGRVTLTASTVLYVALWQVEAPFWEWAIASMLLGLGFTFFSGAVEAWLVDALDATGFDGDLESVFGRAQIVSGIAMLTGSVAGGADRPGDQPRGPVRGPRRGAPGDVRGRLAADARRRLHAREGPAAARRDAQDRLRLGRVRLAGARRSNG